MRDGAIGQIKSPKTSNDAGGSHTVRDRNSALDAALLAALSTPDAATGLRVDELYQLAGTDRQTTSRRLSALLLAGAVVRVGRAKYAQAPTETAR